MGAERASGPPPAGAAFLPRWRRLSLCGGRHGRSASGTSATCRGLRAKAAFSLEADVADVRTCRSCVLPRAGDPDRQPRYRPAHATGASHRGFRRLEPVEDQLHFLAQLRGSGSGLLACHGSPRPFSWRRRQRAGKIRAHVLGGGDGRCGRNLPDHCAEVSLGGAHTCAQLPRIDPLTRAAGERKRLGGGVRLSR